MLPEVSNAILPKPPRFFATEALSIFVKGKFNVIVQAAPILITTLLLVIVYKVAFA